MFVREKLGLIFVLMIAHNSYADGNRNLREVLSVVEGHAPLLLASFEQSEEKKALKGKALGEYFGEVDLFGSDSHFDNNRIINPISPPINNIQALEFDKNILSYGVRGKIPLDINGKITALYNASKHLGAL